MPSEMNTLAGWLIPVTGRFGFPCLEMVSDVLLVLFGFIHVCLVSAAGVCGGDFGNFFKLFLAYIIPQTGGFFMCFAENFCAAMNAREWKKTDVQRRLEWL